MKAQALPEDEPALVRPERQDRRMACFVGSGEVFSRVVLRNVEAELDRVDARLLPDLDTVALVLSTQARLVPRGRTCLVAVDEALAPALLARASDWPFSVAEVHLAIAYREHDFAAGFLAKHGARLLAARVSLLPMNVNITAWVHTLRLVCAGGHYVPPELMGGTRAPAAPLDGPPADTVQAAPAPAPHAPQAAARPAALTPREREVLGMAAAGKSNKIIAGALDLSEHTVKLHMHRVMHKLGVHNRTEAALWYHRHDSA